MMYNNMYFVSLILVIFEFFTVPQPKNTLCFESLMQHLRLWKLFLANYPTPNHFSFLFNSLFCCVVCSFIHSFHDFCLHFTQKVVVVVKYHTSHAWTDSCFSNAGNETEDIFAQLLHGVSYSNRIKCGKLNSCSGISYLKGPRKNLLFPYFL